MIASQTITFEDKRDPSLPPMAWTVFAMKYPDDAKVRDGIVGPISDLYTVNARVNAAIELLSAPPRLGDPWSISPQFGWCHDYAVTKRHELLSIGWPSRALRLGECRLPNGEGHMVLIADGLVLDNMRADLLSPDSTGYDWSLPVQQGDDPNHWERWT